MHKPACYQGRHTQTQIMYVSLFHVRTRALSKKKRQRFLGGLFSFDPKPLGKVDGIEGSMDLDVIIKIDINVALRPGFEFLL